MNNKKIGSFIANHRKDLGLTQQQLADQIGVSNKTISKWETGEGYPDITVLLDLARALSVTADELLSGENHFNANGYICPNDRQQTQIVDDIRPPMTIGSKRKSSSIMILSFVSAAFAIIFISMILFMNISVTAFNTKTENNSITNTVEAQIITQDDVSITAETIEITTE